MQNFIYRLISLSAFLTLAACVTAPVEPAAPVITPGYEEVTDAGFVIKPVKPQYLADGRHRAEVYYTGDEKPGTIEVDVYARRLYYVTSEGRAMRYAIAVGRAGLAFKGSAVVGRKVEWPAWTPTANMIRTQPETYREYRNGLPGGLDNPLGSRALYLYRNGRDSYFRIHGTIDNSSIGKATSAGCIRLFNQDVMDLFPRVKPGTRVVVRTLADSIRLEGEYIDDTNGRAVENTPERATEIAQEMVAQAAKEAEIAANGSSDIDG